MMQSVCIREIQTLRDSSIPQLAEVGRILEQFTDGTSLTGDDFEHVLKLLVDLDQYHDVDNDKSDEDAYNEGYEDGFSDGKLYAEENQ